MIAEGIKNDKTNNTLINNSEKNGAAANRIGRNLNRASTNGIAINQNAARKRLKTLIALYYIVIYPCFTIN
jgi:hypothetical protein